MLARERQRIDAQCTHDIFLAKLLELSEAKIDIKSKHIFEFYKTVSSNLEGQQPTSRSRSAGFPIALLCLVIC